MLPEGLTFAESFVSPTEEQGLLAFFETLEFETITMRGRAARRTVRHYGMQYEYRKRDVQPGEPIPAEILFVRDRCAALMGRDPSDLVQLLVQRYPAGAGIGWHKDAPIFGDEIAGVSLLGRSRLQLRDATGVVTTVDLPPRSAYVMAGRARWDYEHTIPATRELRYSLTFRTLGGGG
jgi:alkylated DNA repair dioxygenase AlkB